MGIRKINVTIKKLRGDMEKISKEQSSIREQQRKIREKLEKIGTQCAQLRGETDLIVKQKKWNQILLNLMCKIIKARQDRDFDKAASLASILRFVYSNGCFLNIFDDESTIEIVVFSRLNIYKTSKFEQ
ncbi:hypothetical protein SLE2022_135210 [Rubroshorea leprosula]